MSVPIDFQALEPLQHPLTALAGRIDTQLRKVRPDDGDAFLALVGAAFAGKLCPALALLVRIDAHKAPVRSEGESRW